MSVALSLCCKETQSEDFQAGSKQLTIGKMERGVAKKLCFMYIPRRTLHPSLDGMTTEEYCPSRNTACRGTLSVEEQRTAAFQPIILLIGGHGHEDKEASQNIYIMPDPYNYKDKECKSGPYHRVVL